MTVIVCCYNGEATLAETLDSLLAQTHRALDILVVDDASTDGTPDVIASFARRDDRVRGVVNDRNRGLAYSRQRGLSEASAELVMNIDADDVAEPTLVARLLDRLATDPAILGVGCWARYFDATGALGIQRVGPTTREQGLELYRRGKLTFMSNVTLFRRADAQAVGGKRLGCLPDPAASGYPVGPHYDDFAEDLDLWCRMSDLGADGRYFVTIPEPLFRYRKPAGSMSTRNVGLMQLKMRWIRDCLGRRRAGLPERSLAAFIAGRGPLRRLDDRRADLAAGLYKRAGFAWSQRRYARLAGLLLLTGLLSPKLVRQKMAMQSPRGRRTL